MLKYNEIKKNFSLYCNKSHREIRVLFFINVLGLILTFCSPKFYQILIDEVLRNKKTKYLIIVCAGTVIVYILNTILSLIRIKYENKTYSLFNVGLRKSIVKHFLNMSVNSIKQYDIGDIKQRVVDDVDAIGNFTKEQIADRYFYYAMAIICLFLLVFINPVLTIISALLMPLLLWISNYVGKKNSGVNNETREISNGYYGFMYNSIQFWKEIKLHNIDGDFINKFKEYRQAFSKLGMKSIKYWGINEVLTDFKNNYLSKVVVCLLGVLFIIQGELTVGTLIMYTQYYEYGFNAINMIINKNVDIKKNNPYYSRIIDSISSDNSKRNTTLQIVNGDVEGEDVSFSYNADDLINNCSFSIEKGEKVAIVGESGCGKTTLIKLMLGMLECQTGELRYSEYKVSDISEQSLYSQVGVVMQDPFFFNMSILDNLKLANSKVDESEIRYLCEIACINDYINSLKDGLNTIIGENGIKLSGGQKQRLAIVRALLMNPKILFLDEATSAIDEINERKIIKSKPIISFYR